MDPRQKALEQAAASATDPNVQQQIRRFMTTGIAPTDPQAVAAISTALVANGLPPITPQPAGPPAPVGPPKPTTPGLPTTGQGGTQTSGPSNVASGTRPSGPSQPNDPSNPNALPSSSAPPTQVGTPSPTPTPTQPPGGPMSPGNLQNVTLSQDQNFAFEKMMTMLGLGPGNRGTFGTSIGKALLPMFQAYLGLGGLQGETPGNMIDNASKSVNGFAGLVGGAKGLMGQLQDYGNSTIGNISKYGDKLSDPHEQQRYMDMATALSTAGDNPLIRQAMADENTRAQYGFDEAAYNGLGTPTGPKNYIKWLQDQAGQAGGAGYSDIIRLFGGA